MKARWIAFITLWKLAFGTSKVGVLYESGTSFQGWSGASGATYCSGYGADLYGGAANWSLRDNRWRRREDGGVACTDDTLQCVLSAAITVGKGSEWLSVTLDFVQLDSWDGERAWVKINGRMVWEEILHQVNAGLAACGNPKSKYKGSVHEVEYILAPGNHNGTIHIEVGADLSSYGADESFAVGNVQIRKIDEDSADDGALDASVHPCAISKGDGRVFSSRGNESGCCAKYLWTEWGGQKSMEGCPEGAGDCNQDYDCAGELICGMDLGIYYGYSQGIDVCVKPNAKQSPSGAPLEIGGAPLPGSPFGQKSNSALLLGMGIAIGVIALAFAVLLLARRARTQERDARSFADATVTVTIAASTGQQPQEQQPQEVLQMRQADPTTTTSSLTSDGPSTDTKVTVTAEDPSGPSSSDRSENYEGVDSTAEIKGMVSLHSRAEGTYHSRTTHQLVEGEIQSSAHFTSRTERRFPEQTAGSDSSFTPGTTIIATLTVTSSTIPVPAGPSPEPPPNLPSPRSIGREAQGIDAFLDLSINCRLIGKGSYGSVHVGEMDGVPVVIKVPIHQWLGVEALQREMEIFTALPRHPCVVDYFGWCRVKDMGRKTVGLVYAYYKSGCLWSLLKRGDLKWRTSERLTDRWTDLCGFARDIAAGVLFLHRNLIIHRDLAARNIFVEESTDGCRAVVGDIGFAKWESIRDSDTTVVSRRWAAPEVLKHGSSRYSQASDVWSFAVVLWEMLSEGGVPWPNLKARGVQLRPEDIIKHTATHEHKCPQGTPAWMVKLLRKCLHLSPARRPKMAHVLATIISQVKKLELRQRDK